MTTISQDFPLTQTANEKLTALKLTLRKGRKQRVGKVVRRRSDQLTDLLNCNICDYKSSNVAYISNHKLQEHNGIKQKCPECTYSHYFSTKVITHFKQVHLKIPKKSNLFTRFCDECRFQTKRQDLLKHHKESLHEGIIYSCDGCNVQTNRKAKIKHHKESTHAGIIYSCDSCTYQTDHKSNLWHHHNAKHLEIILSCDEEQCMFKTKTKSSLTKHKADKHGGILRFRCDFMNCLFGTNRNRDYMRHRAMQSKHKKTKYRPFACTKCDNTFHARCYLKEHMNTHTGEKPCGCSFCPKYLTFRDSLKRHKIVHTGERPFKCSKCNKTFSCSEHRKNTPCETNTHTYKN